MQVVLLHNENAGEGDWSRADLVKLVERAGFKPRYVPLKRGLARPELLDAGKFVIVAGGDGAIRKAALALLGRHRPLAPLPLGTANNIARSLGLPEEIEDIVQGWRKPKLRPFDVGLVSGRWGRRHFVEGVGLGLMSRVIAALERIDRVSEFRFKKRKHKLHRDVCVTAALALEMPPLPARLSFNRHTRTADYLLVEVLNIRRAGPGVVLAPDATPSDGRFEVVTVTLQQRSRLIRTLRGRLADAKHVRCLTTRRAADIRLKVSAACELRIDDSTQPIAANETVRLQLLPGALEFVLPG